MMKCCRYWTCYSFKIEESSNYCWNKFKNKYYVHCMKRIMRQVDIIRGGRMRKKRCSFEKCNKVCQNEWILFCQTYSYIYISQMIRNVNHQVKSHKQIIIIIHKVNSEFWRRKFEIMPPSPISVHVSVNHSNSR